jgi:hypothetical protein
MKLLLSLTLAALIFAVTIPLKAGTINIAVDIDSTRTAGGPNNQPITTQSGFNSWDLSSFTANGAGSSITFDGITFQAFGMPNNGTRSRALGGGPPNNSLTKEFLFNDAANGGIGIRITGLDAGRYAMQSWHYDSDPTVAAQQNAVRVVVRQSSSSPPKPPNLANYAFHPTDPAYFEFQVAFDGQTREVVFFENTTFNRTRLNGFILTSLVPEPASFVTIVLGIGTAMLGRRRF